MKIKKVLLVSNDLRMVEALERACLGHKVQSESTTSIAGGFEKLDEQIFDLLVCESELGDGSSAPLIKEARTINPQIIVVGISNDKVKRELFREQGCNFGVKPSEAVRKLQELLEK